MSRGNSRKKSREERDKDKVPEKVKHKQNRSLLGSGEIAVAGDHSEVGTLHADVNRVIREGAILVIRGIVERVLIPGLIFDAGIEIIEVAAAGGVKQISGCRFSEA